MGRTRQRKSTRSTETNMTDTSEDACREDGTDDNRNITRRIIASFRFLEFDPVSDQWRYYSQRFELEVTISGITDEPTQRNLFLKSVGASTYRLLLDHFSPTPLLQVPYRSIINFLESYYGTNTHFLAERVKFHSYRVLVRFA